MKKIFVATIIFILLLILCGCQTTNEDYDIDIWVDTETGVQYIIYHGKNNQYLGGITPRLNSDGTLYIAHPTEKGGASDGRMD